MLYNIILAVVIAFTAIFSFFVGSKVYYAGFMAGYRANGGEKVINPPKILPKKPKKAAESSEMKRNRQILANIEKFDGLSMNQEDIE